MGWSSKWLGAQRNPYVESVVRGVKTLGCKARRPRRRMAVRRRWRPTRCPFSRRATYTITALVDPKRLDQGRFPSRCLLRHRHRPLLPRLPRLIPTGRHPEHLAEPPHGAMPTFGGDETVATHWSGVWESLRFKQALALDF